MSTVIVTTPEGLREIISEAIKSEIGPLLSVQPSPANGGLNPIDPFRLYDTSEAAVHLGVKETTIRQMPEADLPRQGCGKEGTSVRYYGRDLIQFLIRRYTGGKHPYADALQKNHQQKAAPVLLREAQEPSGVRRHRTTIHKK